jgi:glutathione reductase (NADPH)
MLHVEKAGVTLGKRGQVIVDEYSRTSAPHIFAVGDVTDRMALTPVAIHEAMAFVKTVFENKPTPADHHLVPTAVFTTPEIGVVGATEAMALAKGHVIDVYKSVFRPLQLTLSDRDEKMMMKMIVDQESDKVLGVHIFGPQAAEMIQIVAVALKMGATKAQFDSTIALHPSAAEELVTMRAKSYSKTP